MKKEYHLTISRKDRIYLALFVTFLLGWELIKLAIPFPINITTGEQIISSDAAAIVVKDNNQERTNSTTEVENSEDQPATESDNPIILPVFIMKASADELITIGFSRKIATRIQKYISAGGIIKDENSLKKIYGIDTVQLRQVMPYILFPQPVEKVKRDSTFNKWPKNEYPQVIVDLNLATAGELESLSGIGPTLADRIIKFRNALGGFTTINQIKECYGLTEETFIKIEPQLTISNSLHSFDINQIDPKTFSHPYLSKKIQWMIPSYIKNHGRIKNERELRKVFPPDSNWCSKLIPYLKFESE